MDDISNLIKEARPLYFAKKKRREQIKKVVLVAFILLSTSLGGFGGYSIKEAQVNNNVESQVATVTDDDMYDTSSFYPVDEYGLIAVNY